MKKSTVENYRLRLSRVIDYIHDNLNGDVSVNTLADIAGMSPYHFHRIYCELVQETVNATVRRLRLQRAAADLIRTDKTIESIAQWVGYGSQEAFSRAFLKQLGVSPSEYRKTKAGEPLRMEPFIAILPSEKVVASHNFTVQIIHQKSVGLLGYPHLGDYLDISSVFEKLYLYGKSKGLLNAQTRNIGLYYDDPKSIPVHQRRSSACFSVIEKRSAMPEGAPKPLSIPAGNFATLLHTGPYAELEQAYDWLFGYWLPESGYDAAHFPIFEEYLNDPRVTPPNELLTRIHCMLAE
jgi:AraC family transcriptional regulator